MLRNFLLISIRNILRNKGAAYLNILGLTLGMAACLFLFNYIQFHLSFDQPINDQEVYRLETTSYTFNEPVLRNALTLAEAGVLLSEKLPKIKAYARLKPVSEFGNALFRNQKNDSLSFNFQIEKIY